MSSELSCSGVDQLCSDRVADRLQFNAEELAHERCFELPRLEQAPPRSLRDSLLFFAEGSELNDEALHHTPHDSLLAMQATRQEEQSQTAEPDQFKSGRI
eukprot:SAG31_NODE_2102_length_6442_cov_1.702507_4_plen_100_part_00